jgi:streptomycin 3"-adenylyltransferase
MWVTAATGEMLPKDEAAKWASSRLPQEQAGLLDMAGRAYRGECADSWEGLDSEARSLGLHMKKEIEDCLDSRG